MYKFSILVILAITLSSCIKDKSPNVPAYIYVPAIDFQAGNGQGSSSSNITDAWITVDGNLIGVKDLPALLPVIIDDYSVSHTVRIAAGIKDNGLSNENVRYPFYSKYEEQHMLEPGKADTIRPTLIYDDSDPNLEVMILEDFEGPGILFAEDVDGYSTTYMEKTQEDVFEGDYSGKIYVDSSNWDGRVASSFKYSNLQPANTAFPVYLEVNYKSNIPVEVGVIAHYYNGSSNEKYKGGFNPRDSWNKIYFNLTEDIFSLGASQYAIVFRARYPTTHTGAANIYIDNVKLLHY
ncbi:MAG: hypothetical protein GY810_21195 [Aureispira sp.]|nr:hypothetical protein [Aureispira sp.]